MKKKILIENIIGITTSKKSNEFVIHEKFEDSDSNFLSLRKNELLSTIASSYYKLTNQKLKFSIVEKETLSDFVTSKSQKKDNSIEFTLMKNEVNTIEDLVPEENRTDAENQNLNEDMENNLGHNLSRVGETNNLETDNNPFTNVLIGGGIATGVGIGAAAGSIAACIAFDSIFLVGATGEILGAGVVCLGGFAATGIGLVVAIPSLIGFGTYKIYKLVKEKKKKEFFESIGLDKMKPERDLQIYAITKVDRYFTKRIIIQKNEEIRKYINKIIDIYIAIDNRRAESYLNEGKKTELLKKINKDGKIISNNISKIRKELMKTILQLQKEKRDKIFEKGIPFFKEFIKNFGSFNIDNKTEFEIDKYINKLIQIVKTILKEMKQIFKSFDPKTFINTFDSKINELYEQKRLLDNKPKKDFIDDCKDYIIEPIAYNSVNYGILSLFFKITLIVQEIGINKKLENYNIIKGKIINNATNAEQMNTNQQMMNSPMEEQINSNTPLIS